MEQAIKIAIENGWKCGLCRKYERDTAVLNPLFWQSLGKGVGWATDPELEISTGIRPSTIKVPNENYWLIYWHKFIDHLAEGKDPEEFFSRLF